jgi:hypothetical protein
MDYLVSRLAWLAELALLSWLTWFCFVGVIGLGGLVGTHSESVVFVGGCSLNDLHFLTNV